MPKSSLFKYVFLLFVGVILSILTLLFATIPMRVTRRGFGRGAFWIGHLAIGAGLFVAGVPIFGLGYFALTILVGFFSELEEQNGSIFSAGLLALTLTSGIGALAAAAWMYWKQVDLMAIARTQVATVAGQISAVNPQAQVNVDTLVRQAPSALVIVLILALAIGLIWERRAAPWFGMPKQDHRPMSLTSFSVPDIFVWLTMGATLGAFLQHGIPWLETLSVNALNVFVVLYFFQGLAVIARAFATYRVSVFWQVFWYIVIVLQLFLLVAFLGFVDFWVDFRVRLSKKAAETNKSF